MYCRMISARRRLAVALVAVATIALSAVASPLAAQQPRWPATEPQPRSLLDVPQAAGPLRAPQATSPLPRPQATSPLPGPEATGPLPAEQPRWPYTELQPPSPLGAEQPGWLPAEPQATTPSALPEADTAPSPDRRLMRQVYTTCDGTYHLNLDQGTAQVELGGRRWLVRLQHEKNDTDHDGWRYRVYRHDRGAWPCYVWGFGMDPVPCQGYAVWIGYQPAQGANCVWWTYQWGSRLVTEQEDPVPPVPAPPE